MVGYIHAESNDVSVGLQRRALKDAGCKKIFCGNSDNTDYERPELVNAVKYAEKQGKKSGSIVVYTLEQLAGNIENLSDICKVIKRLKLRLISVKEDVIMIPYINIKNFIPKGMTYIGYIHSTKEDLSYTLQKEVLLLEGCKKIFSGYSEDIDFDRPELIKDISKICW